MRRTTFLLGAAMLAVTACTTKSPDTSAAAADSNAVTAVDKSTDEANLKAAGAKWWDLYNKGDADGVANLYADDGIILAAGYPAAVGRDAIRAFLVKDIADSKAAGLIDNGGDLNGSGISGDMAWLSGAFSLVDGSGKKVQSGKYTTVYRRDGTEWKIIRDTWNSDTESPPAAPPKG